MRGFVAQVIHGVPGSCSHWLPERLGNHVELRIGLVSRVQSAAARWGGGRGDTSAQLRRPLAAPFKTPSRNRSGSSPARHFPALPPCAPEKLLSVHERPRI